MTAFSGLAFVVSRWLATKLGASKSCTETSITHFAEGGYHNVYLLNFPLGAEKTTYNGITITVPPGLRQAILRIRRQDRLDSLAPLQIRNEVGIRKYLAANSKIPTPEVYAWNDGTDGREAFIFEEYIDGMPLDEAWKTFTEDGQQDILKQLAKLLVDLAEIRFDKIGGLDPVDQSYAPSIELGKHMGGRDELHKTGCYNVGPYSTRREYVAGMMDKEIAFATDPPKDDDDEEWANSDRGKEVLANFQQFISLRGCDDLVSYLKSLREKMLQMVDDEDSNDCEPEDSEEIKPKPVFTIAHGDIAGRNIMMQGAKIAALIDWEWASILPISQFWTNGGAYESRIELMEYPISCSGRELTDEEQELCERYWDDAYKTEERLKNLVEAEADNRGDAGNEYWQNSECLDLLYPVDKVIDVARDCMDETSIQRLQIKLDILSDNDTSSNDEVMSVEGNDNMETDAVESPEADDNDI